MPEPALSTRDRRTVVDALRDGDPSIHSGANAELLRRYLESKLPPHDDTATLSLSGQVRIVRDARWTPHVYAGSLRDLYAGFGYALAQDRLWQLDFYRRRALGRLAEVLGPDHVASDRRHRLVGIRQAAELELAHLDAESRDVLDGMAAGINAWMSRAAENLPVEFDILDYEPEPWRPLDTIALTRAFFWQLTGRLDNIAAAEAARRHLPPGLARAFLATDFPDETIVPGALGEVTSGGDDSAGGSNNWVVGPGRTTTGGALLASDPHLPYALPVGLYEVHLKGAGLDVAGACYPGLPGVWFGRNARAAWGITNLVASPRDLYVEERRTDDPAWYREGEHWRRFQSRVERIDVRGAATVEMTVHSTVRGPVVNELLPLQAADGAPLSLRWVGHEAINDVKAVLDVNRAGSWDEYRAALAGWRLPIFNMVYADVDGHIGWQSTGAVPIRGNGDTTPGYRDANVPSHQWTGYLGQDRLPTMADPERGWIATANNKPVADSSTLPWYGWWAPGSRARRLREIFEINARFDAEACRAMQMDTYSARAACVTPALARLVGPSTPSLARIAALLEGWDFTYGESATPPTVFDTFFEHWHARVIAARMPSDATEFLTRLGAGSGLAMRLLTGEHTDPWFPSTSIADEVERAARDALAELTSRLGDDPSAWQWGRVHTVTFRHPLADRPSLEALFSTSPRAVAGTQHVLNNNSYAHGSADGRFAVGGGPEYRLVVDLADPNGARSVLTTGQSGQPGSPHYADQLDDWLDGRLTTIPFTDDAVQARAKATTMIVVG
jgi:penicillin amidase